MLIYDNMSDYQFATQLLKECHFDREETSNELVLAAVPVYRSGSAVRHQPLVCVRFNNKGDIYYGKAQVRKDYIKYLRFLPKLSFNINRPENLLVTLKLTNTTTITSSFVSNEEEPDRFKVPNIEARIANTDCRWFQYNYQQVVAIRVDIEEQIALKESHGYETIKGSFIADILNKNGSTRVPNKHGGYTNYCLVKELVSDTKQDIKNLGVVIKKETVWFNKGCKTETEYMIVSALGVVMVFEGENPDFVTPSKLVYIRLV